MSAGPVVADTFAGRIHVEWDNSATVTPLGQLPFFIEFLKQGSAVRWLGGGLPAALHEPERADQARRSRHRIAVGAGRALALCAHDGVALRPGESAAAGDERGGERRRGAARPRQDRRGCRHGVAAGAPRLHHAAASERAVDTRYRHHGEAALRPPGRRRGELQSAQAGAAVAQLSLLHDWPICGWCWRWRLRPATSIPPSIPRPACGSCWMAWRPNCGPG